MLRTGVHQLEQLKQDQLLDVFGKEKNISLRIYLDLFAAANAADYEKYSEMILNRFNTNSNAIKRTYRNRFNAFDEQAVEAIRQQVYATVNMHDMAVSDGRASCYILRRLTESFSQPHYQGSDLAVTYRLHQLSDGSGAYVITDEAGKIIEIT